MQRRVCQMGDGDLQGIDSIAERQQRMLAESNGDGFVRNGQGCQAGGFRPHGRVMNEGSLIPLRHCLGTDPMVFVG
jgi:hypothetical protein